MATSFRTSVEDFGQATPRQHIHKFNINTKEEVLTDPRTHQERRDWFLMPSGIAYPSHMWLYLCECRTEEPPKSRILWKEVIQ